jgi:hypothetical protein
MRMRQQISTEQYAFSPPFANARQRRHQMFPLTSANIAQPLRHGPSARLGRPATASAIIVGATAIAVLAFAHTSATAAENSPGMAQEQRACAVVLGFDPSEDRYETCVRVLNRNLSQWRRARLIESNRSVCAQKGLEPDTPAFAVCLLNAGYPSERRE